MEQCMTDEDYDRSVALLAAKIEALIVRLEVLQSDASKVIRELRELRGRRRE
jgi:hypothetical protein